MTLPYTLEREEQIFDPQGDLTNYVVIGQEVTEVLVLVPASFKVKRIIRRKWALKDSKQTVEPELLNAPADVNTAKYVANPRSGVWEKLVSGIEINTAKTRTFCSLLIINLKLNGVSTYLKIKLLLLKKLYIKIYSLYNSQICRSTFLTSIHLK